MCPQRNILDESLMRFIGMIFLVVTYSCSPDFVPEYFLISPNTMIISAPASKLCLVWSRRESWFISWFFCCTKHSRSEYFRLEDWVASIRVTITTITWWKVGLSMVKTWYCAEWLVLISDCAGSVVYRPVWPGWPLVCDPSAVSSLYMGTGLGDVRPDYHNVIQCQILMCDSLLITQLNTDCRVMWLTRNAPVRK